MNETKGEDHRAMILENSVGLDRGAVAVGSWVGLGWAGLGLRLLSNNT